MAFRKRTPSGFVPPVGDTLDRSDPINQGLVGFWPFSERGGNIVSNIAKRRSDGILTNGPTWAASAHGRQFGVVPVFDGSNDYINVGSFDFSGAAEFSLVAWVLLTASDQTDGAALICCGNGGGGEQYTIDVRSSPNGGNFRFYTRDGGGGINASIASAANAALSNTRWRLLVGTFSGRNLRQRLYFDGVEVASSAVTNSLNAISGHITSIGARQSGSTSYDFSINGGIAAPRIYARELTSGEVLRIWSDPFAGVVAPSKFRIWVPSAGGAPSHDATGALSAQSATIAGTATHLLLHTSTGALSGQAATIAGTALHPHTSSGALSAGSATIAGTALHPHTSTGALAAQAATIAGTAAKSAAGTHAATGALSGQSATIAGTATHLLLHAATGALSGQSATIAGTALHPHTSSGAFTGQAATIAGTALHSLLHTSSGALNSQSAGIAGSASHASPVIHTSTGAWIAGSATISGAASLNGAVSVGAGTYDETPRKRRFVQRIGEKIVVFNNAGAAIKALVAEEDRLAAEKDAGNTADISHVDKPADIPATIAPSEIEETVTLPQVVSLAKTFDESERIAEMLRRQQFEALYALYQVLQDRQNDEADVEMLLMAL